jgi:hypothetical protein
MEELQTELASALEGDNNIQENLSQEGLSQEDNNQQQEELALYQQDKRWGNHWKSPDDVYNSVKYYEDKFKPIEQVLSKRGIKDPDGLTELFSKYDEYSDPNSDINLTYNSLKNLLEHPKYGQETKNFFAQLAEQQEIEKYGSRLPAEVKEKLSRIEELEQKFQQTEYEQGVAHIEQQIDSQMSEIQSLANKYGFNVDQEAFLMHCLENKLPVSSFKAHFVDMHLDTLMQNTQKIASAAVAKNINKNQRGAIQTETRSKVDLSQAPKTTNDLKSTLSKILKGE